MVRRCLGHMYGKLGHRGGLVRMRRGEMSGSMRRSGVGGWLIGWIAS